MNIPIPKLLTSIGDSSKSGYAVAVSGLLYWMLSPLLDVDVQGAKVVLAAAALICAPMMVYILAQGYADQGKYTPPQISSPPSS